MPSNFSSFFCRIALIAFFSLEYACLSSGRAYLGIDIPYLAIIPYNLLGILVSSLCFDMAIRATAKRNGDTLFIRAYAVTILGLGILGAVCWINEGNAPHTLLQGKLAAFCSGTPLIILLNHYFNTTARKRQGLYLGLILAAAELVWLLFRLLVLATVDSLDINHWLAFMSFTMGASAALTLFFKTPARHNDREDQVRHFTPLLRNTLLYMILVGVIFFILDSLLDAIFFRYDSLSNPIPNSVSLYIWITYPFLGMILDQKGLGIKFFLSCLAFCFASPSLLIFTQDSYMYWVIFSLDIIGRHGAFLFMTLALSRYAKIPNMPKICYSFPYIIQHGCYMAVLLFFEIRHPGPVAFMLTSLFLCCTFSYLSSKIHYAMAMVGYDESTERNCVFKGTLNEDDADIRDDCEQRASFSEKHGLSPREAEVFELILTGLSISDMGAVLHISEHTIRSHVHNILRKAECPNRTALISRFFSCQP